MPVDRDAPRDRVAIAELTHAEPRVVTAALLVPGQLDPTFDRRTGIGASEIAAIAGMSPYATALDIYNLKVGITEPSEPTPWTDWGHFVEPSIANFYAHRRQVKLDPRIDGKTTFRHPQHPWLFASPDRQVLHEALGVQIKNVGQWMRRQWGDDPAASPQHVLCQTTQEAAVMGYGAEDIVAMLGGNDMRIVRVEFDPELWEMLFELAERFWFKHVLQQRPPEMDGSDGGWAFLAAKFPKPKTQIVREATPEEEALVLAFHDARAQAKAWEATKKKLSQQVKFLIGDDLGVKGAGWAAKSAWQKETIVKAHVKKATRVLRVAGKGLPEIEDEETAE